MKLSNLELGDIENPIASSPMKVSSRKEEEDETGPVSTSTTKKECTDNDHEGLLQSRSTWAKNPVNSSMGIIRQGGGYEFVGAKTVAAAFFLFFCGVIFVVVGNVIYFHSEENRGMSMIIVGALMLVPGTYGMVLVYGSMRGWRGYDRNSIDGN